MNSPAPSSAILSARNFLARATLVLALSSASARANHEQLHVPVNEAGAPVRDESGQPIVYDRATLDAMMQAAGVTADPAARSEVRAVTSPNGFVPTPPGAQRPFWQYAMFGSGIGVANITIAPAAPGVTPEIILNGNSSSNFGAANFWHVVRWNAAHANYDQVFVGPLYSAALKSIALANVVGDGNLEIAVALADGRVYLYDLASKTELGYVTTGVSNVEAFALADLNADGAAELIVANANDLFVLSGAGNLLWQVAGAGGYDIAVGQMDNDAALEIATTTGTVVDAGTHAIQWTRNGGFGVRVKLAPLPGETYEQLLAMESWSFVYSYDVRRQLPRWSLATSDNDALYVADVENDGVPEVLLGDGQWGRVHVYDLVTQAEKWSANNPEHGVTNIAVGDVDGDGTKELLWGSGYTSSGEDFLYVAQTTGTHGIEWQSVDLTGPFIGPRIGDLDGDQKPELVVCSALSNSGYGAGRILVFDLATLELRAMSAPIGTSFASLRDVKLRDVDGNGALEIVLATGNSYGAPIEIYSFSPTNIFTKKWASAAMTDYSTVSFVDVADLDQNGSPEVIAAGGGYIYIYNYPATTHSWRSLNLASGVSSVVVVDLDTIGGSIEIAALVTNGDLYTFDGPSRELRDLRQSTGAKILSNGVTPFGLVAGDNAGGGHFLHYGDEEYSERLFRQLGSTALTGLNVLANRTLWSSTGNTMRMWRSPGYEKFVWETPDVGGGVGRYVAREVRNGQERIFSASSYAVVGLLPPHDTLGLTMAASRKTHAVGAVDVFLPATGQFGVESRSGGPNGDHTLVFTFNNDVVSGSAAITDGSGSISAAPSFADNTMTVNLTGVPDAKTVTITLNGVTDNFGQVLPPSAVTVGFLVGDTNGDRTVNAGDALQTRNRSGHTVTWANCRNDVNRDGSINGGDALIVRARSGNGIQ